MPGAETWLLRTRLRDAGFEPQLYRYPTVSLPLGVNWKRFARFIAAAPGEAVHIVGYSLGGVIAVGATARGLIETPGRIVCLGSPLKGTAAGTAVSQFPAGAAMVGQSIRDLNEQGGLQGVAAGRDVGVIAGSGGAAGIGRVLPTLESPHDGVVSVAETQLVGLADHLVLPVTHTSMLFDGEVARQTIAFLNHGRFERGTPARRSG